MFAYGVVDVNESVPDAGENCTASALAAICWKLSADFSWESEESWRSGTVSGSGWLSMCCGEGFVRLSGDKLGIAVELLRLRCVGFGDFEVEENEVLRLKADVLELLYTLSLWAVGDPLLVLGLLVKVGVLLPPNMLPPLNRPPLFEEGVERCISATQG
jgi:hypothetical protein